MACIPWADQSMIRRTPQRETAPSTVAVSQERQDDLSVSLTSSYTTHNPEGNLGVRADSPASVASAPRGGVACNDAATRRDQPMIGWVRDARVRSQEKRTKGQ